MNMDDMIKLADALFYLRHNLPLDEFHEAVFPGAEEYYVESKYDAFREGKLWGSLDTSRKVKLLELAKRKYL